MYFQQQDEQNANNNGGSGSFFNNGDNNSPNVKSDSKPSLNQILSNIPKKDQWQDYSLWRVNVYKSSMLIYYTGKQDGVITMGSNSLRSVLTSLENDIQTTQEKNTYQFQTNDSNYISRTLASRKGGQYQDIVPFRYVRASFKSRKFLLYQNSFMVRPNSFEIDTRSGPVQSTAIACNYDEIIEPLKHISVPSLNTKFAQDIVFENDLD